MNKTLIHFSQDFTKDKPQLGGFSRIYNICSDSNLHIIYTISESIAGIEEYFIDNIRIVQLPVLKRPSGIYNQLKSYKAIAKQIIVHINEHHIRPDLFFGHSHQGNFLILQKVRNVLFPATKVIWEANGIGGCPKISKPLKSRLSNCVQYKLQKYVFKKADKIIAQTNSGRDFINNEFGIEISKIAVVTNAIKVQDKCVLTNKNNDKISILCFGLFDELNGIPFLLDILATEEFEKLSFVFAGYGPYSKMIKKLSELKSYVTYLGHLEYKEMMNLLPSFHYLIIPRVTTLGSKLYIPTKLLEGMYSGVVPICSDVSGMTSVVKNDCSGFLFPAQNRKELMALFNKIKQLNTKTYFEIQEKAHKEVTENYNWNQNHKLLNLIYDTCMIN